MCSATGPIGCDGHRYAAEVLPSGLIGFQFTSKGRIPPRSERLRSQARLRGLHPAKADMPNEASPQTDEVYGRLPNILVDSA